eukprot:SM000067S20301  [mRNA]  locus=s67:99046:103027:- [translate_table: standard]
MKHDKPKPWDEGDVDRWAVQPFDAAGFGGLLEESSFATLFPKYREKYLREAWPAVTRALKEHGIACELNLVEGSMTVSTTRKTKDPYVIIKARDLIKLLSRSVPALQALKVLDDNVQCDIIKIGNLIRNKAIELLTECYVLVQGNTVSAMGPWKGLKAVRRIVEDCIKNVHPIYHIKALMIKRELAKDPELATQNWERFLPKFKKKNVKHKKTDIKKKEYTPFPPPQQPSKVDLQLESGEYFLSQDSKRLKKWDMKKEQQEQRVAANKRKREEAFVPIKATVEPGATPAKPKDQPAANSVSKSDMRKVKKDSKQTKGVERGGAEAYLLGGTANEVSSKSPSAGAARRSTAQEGGKADSGAGNERAVPEASFTAVKDKSKAAEKSKGPAESASPLAEENGKKRKKRRAEAL